MALKDEQCAPPALAARLPPAILLTHPAAPPHALARTLADRKDICGGIINWVGDKSSDLSVSAEDSLTMAIIQVAASDVDSLGAPAPAASAATPSPSRPTACPPAAGDDGGDETDDTEVPDDPDEPNLFHWGGSGGGDGSGGGAAGFELAAA